MKLFRGAALRMAQAYRLFAMIGILAPLAETKKVTSLQDKQDIGLLAHATTTESEEPL